MILCGRLSSHRNNTVPHSPRAGRTAGKSPINSYNTHTTTVTDILTHTHTHTHTHLQRNNWIRQILKEYSLCAQINGENKLHKHTDQLLLCRVLKHFLTVKLCLLVGRFLSRGGGGYQTFNKMSTLVSICHLLMMLCHNNKKSKVESMI